MKRPRVPGKRLSKSGHFRLSEERAFAEVVEMIQAARGRALPPSIRRSWTSTGDGRIHLSQAGDCDLGRRRRGRPGRVHPAPPPRISGALLGGTCFGCGSSSTLTGAGKSVSTADTIAVDPPPLDPGQSASGPRSGNSISVCAIQEKWSSRELERQINSALFERVGPVAGKTLSTAERIASRRRIDLQGCAISSSFSTFRPRIPRPTCSVPWSSSSSSS